MVQDVACHECGPRKLEPLSPLSLHKTTTVQYCTVLHLCAKARVNGYPLTKFQAASHYYCRLYELRLVHMALRFRELGALASLGVSSRVFKIKIQGPGAHHLSLLFTVVNYNQDSSVVQFSHFSVKEFSTASRLVPIKDVSRRSNPGPGLDLWSIDIKPSTRQSHPRACYLNV